MSVATFDLLKGHYRYFSKERLRVFGLLILDSLSAGLEMIPPLFSILVFDYAFPQKSLNWLLIALGGGFLAYLLHFAFSSWGDYLNEKLDNQMNTTLSTRLFQRIANSPLRRCQNLKTGDMTVRLVEDTDIITGLLLNLPSHLLIAVVQLIIFFTIAMILDPWVTILGIIAVPLYIIETHYYSHRLEAVQEDLQYSDDNLHQGLQEKLGNVRTIKAFNQQMSERGRVKELFQKRARLSIRYKLLSLYQHFANSLTLQIWTVVVTGYLGFEVIRGVLTIGEMISLGIYLPLIQEPISELAHLWTQTKIGSVSLRRVNELEKLPQEEISSEVVSAVEPLKGDITFKNVSFAYSEQRPILENLDMRIPENQMTAIVGPSGIGKSTLAHLLLNMYQPDSGEIYYGDKSIHDVEVHDLRQQVSVVFQEAAIFAGTIRDNIRYSHPQASEQDIIEAARQANAHNFITELFQGYDTVLLPWGKNLSVGQRQRIALARALLLRPKALILDEVTSSLDAEAEFQIGEALERLRNEITIVLITHQLSSAKKANQIFFLDSGHIVEQGTFQELMQAKGRFFDLYNIQTGGFQEFRRRLEIEIERHVRYSEPLALAVIEPAHFYKWEESEPPELLPQLMESITQEIRRHLRVMDFASIFTEKRIAIALPQTDVESAITAVSRLVLSLEKTSYLINKRSFETPFLFGVAACSADEWTYSEHLFLQAEENLGEKK